VGEVVNPSNKKHLKKEKTHGKKTLNTTTNLLNMKGLWSNSMAICSCLGYLGSSTFSIEAEAAGSPSGCSVLGV
jgi:hypothetical protein